MNAATLINFKSKVSGFSVSDFENSGDCVAVITEDKIVVGVVEIQNDKAVSWRLFKELKVSSAVSSVAFSPLSRTLLLPRFVGLSYSDKNGVFYVQLDEAGDESIRTLVKGDMDVYAMAYNEEGDKLVFTGGDKLCHILSYQNDSLSECDSMVSDAVAEGSYEHYCIPLSSEGQCCIWHKTRSNYLVIAEISGIIRLLTCVNDGTKESFVCEYVINVGLRLPLPLFDMDLIFNPDKSGHDFIVGCSSGLFLFALDKPLTSLERLSNVSNNKGGNTCVKMSHCWGYGSLLATASSNGQLLVTDISGSKVVNCPMKDCIALSWFKTHPMLLAVSSCSLVVIKFNG